ncbi:MAG: DUF4093 domain-containing protein [Oscillospiraceae bacterium]|nr:DUF4093 domain-containing protein [Oscillospiraceae bacterium]
MIKLTQAVVVEGKYDRMRLSSVLDTTIVETGGFRIFSDDDTVSMLRALAKRCGLIIFTDSDFAGFRIRNFLKNKITEGTVIDAYLPDVLGKEKRKAHPSKEGLLGVEGFCEQDILEALKKAGVTSGKICENPSERITRFDLYELGLSGGKNSAEKRALILKKLSLPSHLSSTVLPDVLSSIISKEDFFSLVYQLFPSKEDI